MYRVNVDGAALSFKSSDEFEQYLAPIFFFFFCTDFKGSNKNNHKFQLDEIFDHLQRNGIRKHVKNVEQIGRRKKLDFKPSTKISVLEGPSKYIS